MFFGGFMNKKLMRGLSLFLLMFIPATSLFTFYQGCGGKMASENLSSSSLICQPTSAAATVDKNYEVLPGQPTVSVAYGRQVLDSMVACTGLGTASTRATTEWQSRNQSLSEYGSATEVSGAMMMAVAAVAGEVCRDLVDKEKALPMNSRGIFTNVDLEKTGSLTSSEIESGLEMLALSCWQRPSTLQEKQAVLSGILGLTASSDLGALSLCTAALSSLAAIAQ